MQSDRSPAPVAERQHVNTLEVSVTPLSASSTADLVLEHVNAQETFLIGNLNLHGVYMFHTNDQFARYCDSCDLVLIDGAPIAWAARVPTSLRIGSTDWLDDLMPRAGGVSILAIGGTPEASAAAATHFREAFPRVQWTGIDGYASHEMTEPLARLIAEANVVLVGMGMPVQEAWILRHRTLLEGKVVANVGGCFDYYAGTQRLAPRWMGAAGIEWVYRLAASPRRLTYRYLVEPLKLAAVLVRMKIRKQRR